MVLFKRKPIAYVDPPTEVDPNAEVWVMRGSDEIFTSYERYLERYDYYSQPNFTDAVNGKTGMTFFEAIESENASTSDIERIFPEALRAPILRKVQFSEIARMDDLVNHVYDEFVNDFFPGEEVTATLDDGEKVECVVREKANFPELRNSDGTIQRPAFCRYFVKIKGSDVEALTDGDHIHRARNIFTKINIRSFLKNCLQREPWIGAPWLVKEFLATQHRLPMTIPPHLTQEAVKAQQAFLNSPAGRGKKTFKKGGFTVDQLLQQEIDQQIQDEAARRDAKFPMDDLDLEPSTDGSTRPRLEFLAPLDRTIPSDCGLNMDSVGPVLEIWNALNVHWDIYEVDPFNFDDFVDALKFDAPNVRCELFEEIHCGVLKTLVDSTGTVHVRLPELSEEAEEVEDEIEVDSGPATPSEQLPKSRLSQVHNVDEHPSLGRKLHRAAEMLEERSWIDRLKARDLGDGGWQIIMVGIIHQLSLDKQWAARCEAILDHLAPPGLPPTQYTAQQQYEDMDVNLRVDSLHLIVMLSMSSQTMRKHLEDRSEEMTLVRKQKVESQRTRKEHLKELQRLELDRAEANPDAYLEEEEVKKENDTTAVVNGNGVDESLSTVNGNLSDEEDEDAPRPLRRSNNARKRKRDEENAKKETERLAALSAQKQSTDKIKKYRKILRDIETTKKKVTDCEQAIEAFDERLRAMNATRMKSLGRDRFWNRYWWFERVGLPIDGVREPTSKRARADPADGAGYANGRLWVQGPSRLEREGFIDMDPADAKAYAARHGLSVAQRKAAEEGSPGVHTASDWGFYAASDALDALIGWLDERGARERDLRRELVAWREDIVAQMDVRHKSLHPEAEDENESSLDGPRTRVSTRNKTYLDTDDVQRHFRVLQWRNSAARTPSGKHCNVEVASGAGGRKVVVKKGVARSSVGGRIVSGGRSAAREAAAAIADGAARERREAAGGSRRGLRSAR